MSITLTEENFIQQIPLLYDFLKTNESIIIDDKSRVILMQKATQEEKIAFEQSSHGEEWVEAFSFLDQLS